MPIPNIKPGDPLLAGQQNRVIDSINALTDAVQPLDGYGGSGSITKTFVASSGLTFHATDKKACPVFDAHEQVYRRDETTGLVRTDSNTAFTHKIIYPNLPKDEYDDYQENDCVLVDDIFECRFNLSIGMWEVVGGSGALMLVTLLTSDLLADGSATTVAGTTVWDGILESSKMIVDTTKVFALPATDGKYYVIGAPCAGIVDV